jgi:hypothetical protein
MFCLAGLLLLATTLPVYGQSLVYCPTAPEERSRRCARVDDQIVQGLKQIEAAEALLRNPAIVLARVEKAPEESLADYRARVRLQKGVATPQSNTWYTVQSHFYNPVQQRMYVALGRAAYWQYIWEGLSFDPDLAEATFKRRERRSRQEKAFQLDNPDSVTNQGRYALETLRVFQRECCPANDGGASESPAVPDPSPDPAMGEPPAATHPDVRVP